MDPAEPWFCIQWRNTQRNLIFLCSMTATVRQVIFGLLAHFDEEGYGVILWTYPCFVAIFRL